QPPASDALSERCTACDPGRQRTGAPARAKSSFEPAQYQPSRTRCALKSRGAIRTTQQPLLTAHRRFLTPSTAAPPRQGGTNALGNNKSVGQGTGALPGPLFHSIQAHFACGDIVEGDDFDGGIMSQIV